MSQDSDRDTISIQIKLAGRSVILRNSIIGAVLCMIMAASASYQGLEGSVYTLIGGSIFGVLVAVMALLGQIAAGSSTSEGQRLNWRAIRFTGLIAAGLGIAAFTLGFTSNDGVGTGLIILFFAIIVGSTLGTVLTVGVATMMNMLRKASQQAQLTESGFDPLQHIESREHARR